jgi:HK97 family phage major capsid protein
MDDIAANAFPVAFGDFMRGYVLAQRGPIRITTDSNINGDSIKFLKVVRFSTASGRGR